MPITLNLAELQKHVPVSSVFTIDKIEEKVKKAERKLMHKYLSATAYEAFITDPSYPAELVTMIKNAVYCYAFFLHLPYMKVRISNAGTSQTKTNTESPAIPENIEDLRDTLLRDAHEALEDILIFLEERKGFAPYDIWKNSTAYTVFHQYFIKTASEFQRWVNIENSRRLFLAITPQIQFVEDNHIQPTITETLFNKLKTEPLTGKYALLLNNYIVPAEANLSMAQSIIPLSVIMGKENTLMLFDNTSTNPQKAYKSATNLDALKKQLEETGKTYMISALNYILENIEEFPEYPQEITTLTKRQTVHSRTAVWF